MILFPENGDRVVCKPSDHALNNNAWLRGFLNEEGVIAYIYRGSRTMTVLFDNHIDGYRRWDMKATNLEYLAEAKLELVRRYNFAIKFL